MALNWIIARTRRLLQYMSQSGGRKPLVRILTPRCFTLAATHYTLVSVQAAP